MTPAAIVLSLSVAGLALWALRMALDERKTRRTIRNAKIIEDAAREQFLADTAPRPHERMRRRG